MNTPASSRGLKWKKHCDGHYIALAAIGADGQREWSIMRNTDGLWRGYWCGKFISSATATLGEQKIRIGKASEQFQHEDQP